MKFTGEESGPSVTSFLERVSELQKARKVTDEELYQSGIDLFHGKAYTWYRLAKNKAPNWQSLVDSLRRQFQPADYNERLYDEIRNGTQIRMSF